MDRRGTDRRGKARFEIVGELWGSIEARSTLTIRNLGSGGALVESPAPLISGSMHWLTAEIDGEPQLVQVRVCHATRDQHSSHYVAGIEFVGLTPAMEMFIRKHMNGAGGAALGQA
ncbi:MAG: PilZ domain-containing protein [Acidobacteria bacterium]|nr:PilZ domain-containing protein [Acidobacteriota bacterium]